MGEGSVTTPARLKPPSWKLKPPHDKWAQGLVVSGFANLEYGQALFLCCDWPENGPSGPYVKGKAAWLKTLYSMAPITDADERDDRAAALALTWTGLQKSGLSQDALATFAAKTGDFSKTAYIIPGSVVSMPKSGLPVTIA